LPSPRWILALDVGGTNMSAALFAEDESEPVCLRRRATPVEEGPEGVVDAGVGLLAAVREAGTREGVDPRRIVGVGAGVPGAVEATRGTVFLAPNLGWRDVPVREYLLERLDLPVVVDNDANCAALGEWWAGAGRGSELMVCVTLGTGIGGGIVREGRILRGVTGAAGEIGHVTIEIDGRPCGCGNHGCVEAYASGRAIARRAREGLETAGDSFVASLVDGDPARITAETVAQAARDGDGYALELLGETARYLGAALAGLVNVLNPDRIVLAGGVTEAGGPLLDPLRAEIRKRAFAASAEACVVAAAREPRLAGLRGAALNFRREVLEGDR
jgi:glucokinase